MKRLKGKEEEINKQSSHFQATFTFLLLPLVASSLLLWNCEARKNLSVGGRMQKVEYFRWVIQLTVNLLSTYYVLEFQIASAPSPHGFDWTFPQGMHGIKLWFGYLCWQPHLTFLDPWVICRQLTCELKFHKRSIPLRGLSYWREHKLGHKSLCCHAYYFWEELLFFCPHPP